MLWSQDIGRVYYPVAILLRQVLAPSTSLGSLWNPDLGAGFPARGRRRDDAVLPPHWPLLVLLPPARALTAALFLGYLGSALAMAAFVRALGLEPRRPPPWPGSSTRGAASP